MDVSLQKVSARDESEAGAGPVDVKEGKVERNSAVEVDGRCG